MTKRGNDMLNKKFGMLTGVKKLARRSKAGDVYWRFSCDCGGSVDVTSAQVKNGSTYNCGCIDRTTHGMSKTKTYYAWTAMIGRCLYPSVNSYHLYGGRGIKFCKRWKMFEHFLADMGEAPTGKSLDRIDVNGNYEPGNCRWATAREQARNTRRTLFYNYEGKKMSLPDIAEQVGINYVCLYKRLKRGYSIEDAVSGNIQRPTYGKAK